MRENHTIGTFTKGTKTWDDSAAHTWGDENLQDKILIQSC